jgi:hypothetical protein
MDSDSAAASVAEAMDGAAVPVVWATAAAAAPVAEAMDGAAVPVVWATAAAAAPVADLEAVWGCCRKATAEKAEDATVIESHTARSVVNPDCCL